MEDYWKAAEAPKERKGTSDKEALNVEDFVAGMNDAKENGMEKLFEDKDVTDDLDNVVDDYFDKNKDVEKEVEDVDDSEDENEFEGINYEDFLRKDKGGAALQEGDQGFDEEMGAFSQNVADAEMELVDDISMAESDDEVLSSTRDANSEIVEKEETLEGEVTQVKTESKENDSRIQAKTELDPNEMNTQECQASLFAEIDTSLGYQYTPQCSQEGKKLLSSLKSTKESNIKEESRNTETSEEKEDSKHTIASRRGQEIRGFPQHKKDKEKKSKKSSSTPSLEKENEVSANSKNTLDDDIQTKTPNIVVTSSPPKKSVKPPKGAIGRKRKADTKTFSSKKFLHLPSYLKGKK